MLKITLEGTSKEIADLVSEVQSPKATTINIQPDVDKKSVREILNKIAKSESLF